MKRLIIIFCLLANYLTAQTIMDENTKISRQDVKKMLSEFSGKLNPFIEEKYFIDTYELSDSRAIMDFGSHGFLFNSLADAKFYLERISTKISTGKVNHIFEGKFSYDDSFPLEVKSLEKIILDFLGKREAEYTKTELELIEKYVSEKLDSKINLDNLFPNLIAYIGEYIIHNLPLANWEMVKSDQFDIWEPYVVDDEGNRYNPFYIVYKELYEYYPEEGEISLSEHTQVELNQHRVRTK